jgi:hypothetical protein
MTLTTALVEYATEQGPLVTTARYIIVVGTFESCREVWEAVPVAVFQVFPPFVDCCHVTVPTFPARLIVALLGLGHNVITLFGEVLTPAMERVPPTERGYTDATIEYCGPTQPAADFGVTKYSTVPVVDPDTVKTWLIVVPELAVGPETPETVPIVQVKVLFPLVLAASAICEELPVHTLAVFAAVTTGSGFTVTVIVYGFPPHKPVAAVGVTKY